MTDKNFNPTSPFIAGQLPEFVRVDHPTLVAFLTAYYEWLDSDNTFLRSPKKLASVIDVDSTLEEFISYFKNEYLLGFPEKLAVSETTKKPVDPVKLMKNIKGFYRAKGTEKTYDFLFRILFDTSVEFYYPKNDIMKLSDGKWVVRRSIKTSNNIGNAIFDSIGATVVQRDANGDIAASGRVIEVSTYRVGTNDIAELFLGGVNGQFAAGYDGIEFTDKTGILRKENRVFSVIGKITITNGGSGYKAGDRVIFASAEGDTGVKASARVAEVDALGKIRKILIDNYGVNYKVAPAITIESEAGTGFVGSVTVNGMAEYQGYYANNDGRLSTNKVIQDNHYYQNFSYVILSEVTVDRYRDVLKRLLNPAGLAFFGKVQIKRCAVADLQNSTSLVEYEVPIIGHYAPYTFKTYDDLSNWFTDPNTGLLAGYDPTVHNQIIRNDLDENGIIDFGDVALAGLDGISSKEYLKSIGNPVTFNRAFQNPLVPLRTANFQNADPFWIVYQHPNRKIRGSVTARIPYDLKNEFLNDLGAGREFPFGISSNNSGYTGYWAEWTEGSTANRTDWATGFTSGERYVTLNYNPVKPYTQTYYEPQSVQEFLTPQNKLVGQSAFLPKIYYDNVFTLQGYKDLEKLKTDNSKSVSNLTPQKNLSTGTDITLDYYLRNENGEVIGIDETQTVKAIGSLSPLAKNLNNSDTSEDKTSYADNITLQYNRFTNWDSEASSHYPKVGAFKGIVAGTHGLTNTSKAAMDKFVSSLLGDIKPDWNGISGAGTLRLGDNRYTFEYDNLIAMNNETWDPIFSSSVGRANPDDPNSVGNFIMNKYMIPIFVGGTGADGLTFDGLQQKFPNALFANYGQPYAVPRNILKYHDYPGFSGDARSSKFETLTRIIDGKSVDYKSYVPSPTCPDCRWDGRDTLDTNDPQSSKASGLGILDVRFGTKYRDHALKLWKEQWTNYARNVNVWMPSFYVATENIAAEKALQNLTITEMVKWRQEIAAEKGYDNVLIIPFISNKAYTVGTGSGGYGAVAPSIQDGSFFSPSEFVNLYIEGSLSGNPKGSVHGFYLWSGDDTYTKKWGCAISSPNPRTIEITGADGSVIDWKLNPLTVSYGFEPYWDFAGGEALRPGAPTGPGVPIGLNGKPRVSWLITSGKQGGNPWWGGSLAPVWPTASAPARLTGKTPKTQARMNLLSYEAFLDGMTGQTGAQFVFDKPEKYAYLKTKYPSFFEKTRDLPEWGSIKEYTFRIKKFSANGANSVNLSMAPGTTFAFNYRTVNPLSSTPIRSRDGVGVTGDIISNPLFNSLTGSATVFSYPDGRSYQDKGWNTADRIGYVKRVQAIDANTVEIGVEPFFFVGQPQFTQEAGNDVALWTPAVPFGSRTDTGYWGVDGATHGFTSGNAPYSTCLGASNPVTGDAQLKALDLQKDPSYANQRPRWVNLGFPGDIISFGAIGATFELVSNVSVSGDFPRISKSEVDNVFALTDKINYTQIEAALNYWNQKYNNPKTTDFAFEYDVIGDSWYAYGPGDRIIINGWTPPKPGTSNCSNSVIKPNISVITNDNDGTMEVNYTYTNTCSEEKIIDWLDTPSLNLGDSIEYYDTKLYGATGSPIGTYRTITRNGSVQSARYPDILYSPIHLAKTKFEGACCEQNNFAVSMSVVGYQPEVYGHDISLVVFPPQDNPAVAMSVAANQNYKAYVDRYSFQFATQNESQLYDSAKIPAGETRTYKVVVKFNTIPISQNLIGGKSLIEQDVNLQDAAAFETLSVYKDFLDSKYPHSYIPDYRPVKGVHFGYEHLVNLSSPTASNYNPYGWDTIQTKSAQAGGYPNVVGMSGPVNYVKDQIEKKGWDRVMIWTPSGAAASGNYPVRAVSHWDEPDRIWTTPLGATFSITNNMDDGVSLFKSMIDALDDDKQVGFWFGNSLKYQTEFGGTLYPFGSTGYDDQLILDQLDRVANITINSRGVSKGMIGLDAWHPSNAPNEVSYIGAESIRNSYLSLYEGQIKYVTESRNSDYMHRKDATYLDLFNASNGNRNVTKSFGLANYLTPDHETWVGCNWYSSNDPALRGFGGDPTRANDRDVARGTVIKELIDMGYVPVVFDEIDRAYIFGGDPGPTACTGCDCCQFGCFTLGGLYDCLGCSGCPGCTGCPATGPTCSGPSCCGTTANGNACWNTFLGVYDCEGCSGLGGCTGCPSIPQDPCDSCHPGIPCLNIMTGLLDCEGCSGCFGCTGCGITAPATGCALCSSVNLCHTVDGIYDCAGCSGCHGCTGCPQGPTGATGCNLCRSDAPCWTLSGIYDCEGCSGCFGCLGCTTTTPCIGCECCTGGCFNKATNLYDCEGCSGCFGCTGCGITGVSAGATSCTGSGGTACCGTTGSGTLCYNIVTGIYDCVGCSGFNGCTGCGITGSLTGCALCSQENPCFTIDGFYDCQGCSGCWGCLGCSITGATSCTGCGCCSTSVTGGCYNIVTGLYDCEGCSGCFSCTGCPVTGGCTGCECCLTGGYNRITGLLDCEGCSGCYGFTGCGVTAPATGCDRCSQVNPCFTMDIPTGYDCEGCSGCWQCTGCPVTGPTCSGALCCGTTANGFACWNTFLGVYDCLGCSGFGGCTGCAITGASAGPTGCAACSTWEGLPCYNIVSGMYDCAGCSGCHSCTGCSAVVVDPGCTGCSCCSPIFDCFSITGSYDCAGCSGCYNCEGCKTKYTKCSQCTVADCTVGTLNYDFCVDCGCGTIYTSCEECTQLDCDSITVNTKFCRNTCGCVPTTVLCDECVKNDCNGIRCRTECDECIYDGPGKYTNCNQCLQGDCDYPSSINYEFCVSCGCEQSYTLCSQCTPSDCDNQYSINNSFCRDCGCTPSISCSDCVANGCVSEGCDVCADCPTQQEYDNCGQCLPIDCYAEYRVNHTYCVETCNCELGQTGSTSGETGDNGPILALTTLGSRVDYSEFRKITLRSFLEMPVGPEFNCKDQEVLTPPVPQVKVVTVNGKSVDIPEWSTDTQYVVDSEPGSRSMNIQLDGVLISSGELAGLSTLLYLSYYSAISLWADLSVVDETGKEYQMASVGPFPTSANSINILYPFVNPDNPNSEPGAITLGRGTVGSPFSWRGNQYPNTNCVYRLKLYFRNVSNAIITGSETVKEFNYQLT
jgi:hypothetical protein